MICPTKCNPSIVTKKCYQSNKRSYHQIRKLSDSLCKENNLIVIDEHYEHFKKKYKTKGKNWYENQQHNKGTSWKSKLQFNIDRIIKQAKDWEDFLKRMDELGYEIKQGKHIAFKPKDKQRFTRAKTIGEDYTEEKLKERISARPHTQIKPAKKSANTVIDITSNEKVKSSKAYEIWARKHTLKAMAKSVVELRDEGLDSLAQLEQIIQKQSDSRQELLKKLK